MRGDAILRRVHHAAHAALRRLHRVELAGNLHARVLALVAALLRQFDGRAKAALQVPQVLPALGTTEGLTPALLRSRRFYRVCVFANNLILKVIRTNTVIFEKLTFRSFTRKSKINKNLMK